VTLGYENVQIPDVVPPPTVSTSGTDHYVIAGLGYGYDSRDLKEFPNYGAYVRATITKDGFPGAEYDVIRYALDVRGFQPLARRLVVGARAFTDIAAAGEVPPYNHVYFGYGERIRGHFKEIMEGESIMGGSAEVRYSLFDPFYVNVGFLPSEFATWRFGLAVTAYYDAGTVWTRPSSVALNEFSRGYGVGIDYLLPYSLVLRTEYAWNEARRGEFIVDVGASF